ncbi:MAG: hypothetical protein ACD_45C00321G0004 [uncultured bacterium]|nr:MAG: hypothetical protein ACD_45C00321G0004 [uncultured bacterium]
MSSSPASPLKEELLNALLPLINRHKGLKKRFDELTQLPLADADYFDAFMLVFGILLRKPEIMQDKQSKSLKLFTRYCANHISIIEEINYTKTKKIPRG